MLQCDLTDAGIEAVDKHGRIVDFHGQRTTFITGLAKAGLAPATAQKLARHSDVNLALGTCTRLEMKDLSEAVDKLSKLVAPKKRGKAATTATEKTQGRPPADGEIDDIKNAWPRLTAELRAQVMQLISDALKEAT